MQQHIDEAHVTSIHTDHGVIYATQRETIAITFTLSYFLPCIINLKRRRNYQYLSILQVFTQWIRHFRSKTEYSNLKYESNYFISEPCIFLPRLNTTFTFRVLSIFIIVCKRKKLVKAEVNCSQALCTNIKRD